MGSRVVMLALCLVPGLLTGWVFWHAWPGTLLAPNHQLPVRDYLNLWAGGQLAADGRLDVVFDPQAYAGWLWSVFGSGLDLHSWGYPPHLLFVAIPLGHLPLVAGFLVWGLGTAALLFLALRAGGMSPVLAAVALGSPAVLENVLLGQNGALTAAALAGGLLLADRRKVMAGALLGLLTVKPQLGLLVPIALVAARDWKTLLWAAVFGGGYCALGLAAFGWEAWHAYLTVTAPFMRFYIDAPFGLAGHHMMVPPFITLRALGFALPPAYAIQTIISLACAALTAWAWSPGRKDRRAAIALVLCLTPLTTPYAHAYDLVAVAVACVLLARTPRDTVMLAPAWIWPGIAVSITPGLGVLCVGCAAWVALRRLRRDPERAASWTSGQRGLCCDQWVDARRA